MITVSILINGKAIFTRSARNVTKGPEEGLNIYKVDDGKILYHLPEDGAVKLAIEMLKGVREP